MNYKERRAKIEEYFQNPWQFQKEEKSPCGKYSIEIYSVETKPGAWKFSVGVVKNQAGEKIAEIKRNYSSFWFTFHEDYLFCGEDFVVYNKTHTRKSDGKDFEKLTLEETKIVCDNWEEFMDDNVEEIVIPKSFYAH